MEFVMKDCTILVNSCDKYKDAWEPFFRLLKIHWPKCPYEIILSTETQTYDCDFLNIRTINCSSSLSWSSRLKNVLNKIQTEYVLFFLEDFFLMSSVNEKVFSSALNLLKNNHHIGAISFNPDIDKNLWKTKGVVGDFFTEVTKKSKYRVNAVSALWRKDFLLSLIKDGESPWEFEVKGTRRAKFKTKKILCVDEQQPKVFDFHIYIKYGYGISKQSWLPKNKELFEKYGINVAFDNLGWYENKLKGKRKKRSLKEKLKLIYTNPLELLEMLLVKLNQMKVK